MEMDAQHMIGWVAQSGWFLPGLGAWTLGGVGLGLVYFRFLRHSAGLMVAGGAGPGRALLLVLLRVAGMGGILLIAAMQGALPLLATTLGVMIGRHVVMRQAERDS